jgi:hypothetical protein
VLPPCWCWAASGSRRAGPSTATLLQCCRAALSARPPAPARHPRVACAGLAALASQRGSTPWRRAAATRWATRRLPCRQARRRSRPQGFVKPAHGQMVVSEDPAQLLDQLAAFQGGCAARVGAAWAAARAGRIRAPAGPPPPRWPSPAALSRRAARCCPSGAQLPRPTAPRRRSAALAHQDGQQDGGGRGDRRAGAGGGPGGVAAAAVGAAGGGGGGGGGGSLSRGRLAPGSCVRSPWLQGILISPRRPCTGPGAAPLQRRGCRLAGEGAPEPAWPGPRRCPRCRRAPRSARRATRWWSSPRTGCGA